MPHNPLDKTKKPKNFDKIPNPLYAAWVYWWLKEQGADVSRVTPRFCYSDFIREYPEYVAEFLRVASLTSSTQKDLEILLIDGGILDVLGGVVIE